MTLFSLALVAWGTFSGSESLALALYWIGVAIAAALLLYEHSLVRAGDLSRLDAAFFTMNGVISVAFALFVIADAVVG